MKKITSNKKYIIKIIWSALVGIAFQLAFQLPSSFAMQITLLILCALLFSSPYIINVEVIKNYKISGIKQFILSDIMFVLPEAIISSAITELVYYSLADDVVDYVAGMGSLIFVSLAILLTLVFWIAYVVINAAYKEVD